MASVIPGMGIAYKGENEMTNDLKNYQAQVVARHGLNENQARALAHLTDNADRWLTRFLLDLLAAHLKEMDDPGDIWNYLGVNT